MQEFRDQPPVPTAPAIRELKQLTDELRADTKQGRFGAIEPTDGEVPVLLRKAGALAGRIKTLKAILEAKEWMDEEEPGGAANRLEYLRACSWVAEVLEYFGRTTEAREVVEEEGQLLYGSFSNMRNPKDFQLRLVRQKVWMVLHYAYCSLYLRYEYQQALRVVDTCDEIVTKLLQPIEFPCYYTRSRIAAHRASIFRQSGQLRKAQECYESALWLIHKRLEAERQLPDANPARFKQEAIRANYETAKILSVGIGWTQSTRGLLKEAKVNVVTALVMLSPINDVLRTAYARLLLAAIERAEAGFDPGGLDRALQILKEPKQIFTRYGHGRYLSRCHYEEALGNLYRGKAEEDRGSPNDSEQYYSTAEKCIRRVLEFSRGVRDTRWECISYTVLSRISRHRRDFGKAKEYADHALFMASSSRQDVLITLDAHLARGEANLAARAVKEALRDFEAALTLGENNPKTYGVCHLHLANAHLGEGDIRKAMDHFRNWDQISKKVEHGVVQGIAADVKRRLDAATQPLFMLKGDKTLNYEQRDRELRIFLMAAAATRHKTVEAIADDLGIKRATYYKWLERIAH